MLPQAVLQLSGTLRAWTASASRQLRSGGQFAVDLLYPPCCAYCGTDVTNVEDGLLLCARCAKLLVPDEWDGCGRCGAHVGRSDSHASDCVHCRGRRWAFETVVALGPYQSELREAVLRTKRAQGQLLATTLGRLHALRRRDLLHTIQADLVVPVPLHWCRHLARGTNGVELLAEQIALGLGLPLESQVLYLARNTHLQRNLPLSDRARNVRDAFRLRRGYDLRGTTVLLVDDVLTTGATASEAARTLKREAAVARVAVAVVARAAGRDFL